MGAEAGTDGKHADPVMAAPSKQRRHMNETDKPVVTLELMIASSDPRGRQNWQELWCEELSSIPSDDELRKILEEEATSAKPSYVNAVQLTLWRGTEDTPLETVLWTDAQDIVRHYYAVMAEDRQGPAYGVGETETEAKQNAKQWGFDDSGIVIEITEDSYAKILAGDPQAVEMAE
jgi:hypothetical protein